MKKKKLMVCCDYPSLAEGLLRLAEPLCDDVIVGPRHIPGTRPEEQPGSVLFVYPPKGEVPADDIGAMCLRMPGVPVVAAVFEPAPD